jgi:hypothetical protein
MNDQFGGNFNPYFDGDLNKAYMENMYQPQADAGAGMGNMGGGATIATNCGAGGVTIAACATFSVACQPSRLVICNEPSRFIPCNPSLRTPCISNNRFGVCLLTRRNDSICCLQLPPWWTKITTTFPDPRIDPRINPGDINGGGGFGQMGDGFNGSFDPYSGY